MVLPVDVHQKRTTSSEDIALARELIARAESHDGRPPVSDQAMIEASQGQRELTLFAEGGGSEAADPEAPIAVGIVGNGELDLVVDPAARGRGVGTAALAALLDGTAEMKAWSHGENPAADTLLEHAGFTPVRSLYLMELDPALLPAVDPATDAQDDGGGDTSARHPAATAGGSQDLTLRTFTETDAPAWVRVNAAAFASHPEQGRITEADFAAMRAEPWFDAADLILLEEAGEVIGSTWIKTAADGETEPGTHGRLVTELYAIGIDPAHSGKGLGRLLLDATLARMAQHSPQRVSLYVDGDNDRAVGMYEAAGFTIASRSMQWSNAPIH